MVKIDYERQTGIIDIKDFRENKITIVGCGAIGSFMGISLAKMGLVDFTLYDLDTVEPHNVPNQFFGLKDVGKNKAVVTAEYMKMFNNEVNITRLSMFTKQKEIETPIVISCVDKMEVRKWIFDACKKSDAQLFIDTRMGGLEGHIYFVDMTDKNEIVNYEKSLFTDEQAVKLKCTERSILFTVLGIVSFACSELIKAFKGEEIRNYIVIDYKECQLI